MSGTIFSISSIAAFSVQQAAPKRCRKECNKKQEKRELWQSRSRRWTSAASSSTAPSSSASSRPGILRAPSQEGSNLTAQCAGKPAAGGSNKNDAASSPQVWLTDAKMSQSFPERARKFRYQRRGQLEVAAQSPRIWSWRTTPWESLLEFETTTRTQARRQNGGAQVYIQPRISHKEQWNNCSM